MWSWKSDGNVLSTQQRLLTGNNEQDMMIHDENWDLTNLKHSSLLKGKYFWTWFFEMRVYMATTLIWLKENSETHRITGFGRWFCFPPGLMHELQECHYPEGRTNSNIQSLNCPWSPISTHICPKNTEMFWWTKPNWMDCGWTVAFDYFLSRSLHVQPILQSGIPTIYPLNAM